MPTWLPPPRAFAAVLRSRNRDNSRPWGRWCTETLAWSPTLLRDGSPSGLCWIAAPTALEGPRDQRLNTRFSFCSADCTEGVAKTKNDWNSRRCSSPATVDVGIGRKNAADRRLDWSQHGRPGGTPMRAPNVLEANDSGHQFGRKQSEFASSGSGEASKKDNFGVGGKSQLGLASRAAVKFPGSYPLAIGTSAIPLGKTTPGC